MNDHPWRRFGLLARAQEQAEPSYVPTIAERMLQDADSHGVGHAVLGQMTIDECIELAVRKCQHERCLCVAECDTAGACLADPWPYDDHPADDPR
jgi:hypothetical protein